MKRDFVLTIDSDHEERGDPSDDEKASKSLNPDFEFALDDYETTKTNMGWEFQMKDEPKKESVDLDSILRKKGGLSGLEKQEEDASEGENEDDDELAMDGFGMGASEKSELDDEPNPSDQESEEEEQEESEPESEKEDSTEAIGQFFENAETEKHSTFQSLDISRPVLKGIGHLGYAKPSPIQAALIPIALLGKDIVAGAVTGSGKTAAYMIPILERLLFKPSKMACTRVIILAPTRELAIQVADVGRKLGRFVQNLTFGIAVGGLNLRQQEQQLKTRPDIVVATPGRLIDHIRNSGFNIDSLEIMVLDEADRMLEEGFQAELTEILSLVPKHKRQTMLFSATMNTRIQDLIQLSLNKPVRIMIDPPKAASLKLVQEFLRIRQHEDMKPALLLHVLRAVDPGQQTRTVVFVTRKSMAHRLRIVLGLLGMRVLELHGLLTQEQRLASVESFKSLEVPVLICTDLAARGLDIPKIELVINYDMPKTHEIYLHRVGRTARAGRQGRSITFVGEAQAERNIVKAVIKSLDKSKQKALSRVADWNDVRTIHAAITEKNNVVEEVLDEERAAKELLAADMELRKADNMIKHGEEIHSRAKRTWFESKNERKRQKVLNLKQRKAAEAKKEGKVYSKTRSDRESTKRPAAVKGKGKAKGKGRM